MVYSKQHQYWEYEITIRGTGEVLFKGNFAFKQPLFQEQRRIYPEDVIRLVEAFRKSGFLELGDTYGGLAVDGSDTSLTLVIDGNEKKVTRLS